MLWIRAIQLVSNRQRTICQFRPRCHPGPYIS
jgi:hypothetical protein